MGSEHPDQRSERAESAESIGSAGLGNTDGSADPEPSAGSSRPEGERYTHGYHEVIVGSYAQRTAQDCAAFLLPRLRPEARVLDLGCGPGTITVGLARRAGSVVGVDVSKEMVEQATAFAANAGIDNVRFEVGSVYELPWEDDRFDVVHAHQVMQHLADPVRALREARRVLRPGGLVAVRDADFETMIHAPVEPEIERWRSLHHQVAATNGGEAHAGRFLLSWVLEAGFVEPVVTSSAHTYADTAGRVSWGQMWAVRVLDSDFTRYAIDGGLATQAELREMSSAFRRWASQPDGFWAFLNGEVVAVCPPA